MTWSARNPLPFDLFDSPSQRQWKHDRARRQRIPLEKAWRGCLGLAAALDVPDAKICHIGPQMLVPTEQVRWFCMRDVPVHHFPGSKSMNRREVNYVNSTRATLRYGTPILNFNVPSRDALDFRFLPFGSFRRPFGNTGVELVEAAGDVLNADRFPREFAILNGVNAAMTDFAFCGMDMEGRPVRRPWFQKRPATVEPFGILPAHTWMPVPYLAFPAAVAEQLYYQATQSKADHLCFECPRCHKQMRHGTVCKGSIRVFEDGNFVAPCTCCGGFFKWYLADAVPSQQARHFSEAFRRGFCNAVANGLPLRTTEPAWYLGPVGGDGSGPKVVGHQFMSAIDRQQSTMFLPANARIYVAPGGTTPFPAGSLFGRALNYLPSENWLQRSLKARWSSLDEPCGGRNHIGCLQQVWFNQQMLRLPDMPEMVLVPAALVGIVVRDIPPRGLWWNFSAAAKYFDEQLSAFTFPPLQLSHWDGLRMRLPGEIDLDAGIADPRLLTPSRKGPQNPSRALAKTA